jgi:hypothetical protein
MASSKFTELFDERLKNAPAGQGRVETTIGRPPGKRSHVDYKQRSVLLRNESVKLANRRLEDEGDRRDFSELLQDLLDQWLKTK